MPTARKPPVSVASRLAKAIQGDEQSKNALVKRRTAEVTDVDTTTNTVSLLFPGETDEITDVYYLNSYWPVVGDNVWVDFRDNDLLIIGVVGPSQQQQDMVSVSSDTTCDSLDLYKLHKATAAVEFTLPANADDPIAVGARFDFLRYSSGAVTIVGDSGVTVRTASTNALRTQYSVGTAQKIGTDEWVLVGDYV